MAGVGFVTVSLRRSMNRVPRRRGLSSSLNHRTDKGLAPARGLQDATRDRAVHERPTRATDMGTGQQGWEKQEQTKRKTNGWKFEREALFCGHTCSTTAVPCGPPLAVLPPAPLPRAVPVQGRRQAQLCAAPAVRPVGSARAAQEGWRARPSHLQLLPPRTMSSTALQPASSPKAMHLHLWLPGRSTKSEWGGGGMVGAWLGLGCEGCTVPTSSQRRPLQAGMEATSACYPSPSPHTPFLRTPSLHSCSWVHKHRR